MTELGQALAGLTSKVRVVGYADVRGGSDVNAGLGQKRAQAIADALSAAGVDKSGIEAASGGEYNPEASSETEPGRAENRRTELVIVSR